MKNTHRKSQGFTLIELLITLALMAILITIGIPSFESLIKNNRRTATMNELLGHLQVARSEAIKRGQAISVCKSADGLTCATSGNWEDGWLVFVDPDTNGTVEDTDGNTAIAIGVEILQVRSALAEGVTLRSGVDYFSFNRNGTASAAQVLTFCDSREAGHAHAVLVSVTGQSKTSETAADGSALACPT